MNKTVLYGAFGILLGLSLGYILFSPSLRPNVVVDEMHTNPKSTTINEHAMHEVLEVDSTKPTPAVAVTAIPDAKGGYNIHVTTQNFRFSPENVNQKPVSNEGHAHIFVNGEKLTRLYGEWFYLNGSDLQSGPNDVLVTLNANDHSELTFQGEHIQAVVTVTVE